MVVDGSDDDKSQSGNGANQFAYLASAPERSNRGSVERSRGVRRYKTKHINPATVKLKVKIDCIRRCNKKINLACNDMKQIIKPIMF